MPIEEILKKLAELFAGTTDDTIKQGMLDQVLTTVQPLGFVAQSSVQGLIETQVSSLKKKNVELLGKQSTVKEHLTLANSLNEEYTHVKNILHDFGIELDSSGKLDDTKLEEVLRSKGVAGGDASKDTIELERKLRAVAREKGNVDKLLKGQIDQAVLLNNQLAESSKFIETLMVDDILRSSLRKNGFEDLQIDYMIPALKVESKAVVEIDETTGIRTAVTDDGKAVSEWVDWFANTDKGKALKPAPKNTGGGSGGNDGTHTGGTKLFKDMSIGEKVTLFKADPAKYKQLSDSA